MISVTRLNRSSMVLNCDLIERVEMTPDTVITLTNNQKFTVTESAEEIIQRVVAYRRALLYPGQFETGQENMAAK